MFGKSAFFALALAASLVAPMKSLAQIAGDAGVSGIPHGPGSAGGLNNSVNDPSGIGNAARIQSPPPPYGYSHCVASWLLSLASAGRFPGLG